MIIGECPYGDCEYIMFTPIAPHYGFSREICKGCKRPVWIEHTRISPGAYTEEGFCKEFDVDHESRKISRRAR